MTTLDRDGDATTWAGWFKALGDPTRILILHLLATEARPMTAGEIVDALDVGQSTMSHHLQILGETCFVHVERVGTRAGGGSTSAAWPASRRPPS